MVLLGNERAGAVGTGARQPLTLLIPKPTRRKGMQSVRAGKLALGFSLQAAGIEQKGDDAQSERKRYRRKAEMCPEHRHA